MLTLRLVWGSQSRPRLPHGGACLLVEASTSPQGCALRPRLGGPGVGVRGQEGPVAPEGT